MAGGLVGGGGFCCVRGARAISGVPAVVKELALQEVAISVSRGSIVAVALVSLSPGMAERRVDEGVASAGKAVAVAIDGKLESTATDCTGE